MNLRPQPAAWFELILARDDLPRGLRALARTQAVELSVVGEAPNTKLAKELRTLLAPCNALLAEHGDELPQPQPPPDLRGDLLALTRQAAERLGQWQREAAPLLARLQELAASDRALGLHQALAQDAAAMGFALAGLAQAGPQLTAAFALFQGPLPTGMDLEGVLFAPFSGGRKPAAVLLYGQAQQGAVQQRLTALKGRLLPVPHDWYGSNAEVLATLDQKRAALRHQCGVTRAALAQINAQYAVAQQTGWVLEMNWLLGQLPAFRLEAVTAHAAGWCAPQAPEQLTGVLEKAQVRGLAHRAPPPAHKPAPMVLHNPGWAQPFEVFIRALGMPGATEADPSILLAAIAPLIFGYMFGDVGQGGILILAGLLLRRRLPLARLLVPGGAMAILFGSLYGSLFSLHGLIAPRWLDPLQAPLTVLAVPLIGGFALLSLGLLLNALEASWQKRTSWWLHTQMGLLLAYWGAGWTFAHPSGVYLLIFGLLWHFIGNWRCHPGSRAVLAAASSLLEQGMQLAVNTLSFVRIGAFALAHAGLSMALVSLAQAAGGRLGYLLVLVIGNAVMIVLETMVVSIQTTRLILLEFFLRFAAVHGRQLQPLTLPGFILPGRQHHESD